MTQKKKMHKTIPLLLLVLPMIYCLGMKTNYTCHLLFILDHYCSTFASCNSCTTNLNCVWISQATTDLSFCAKGQQGAPFSGPESYCFNSCELQSFSSKQRHTERAIRQAIHGFGFLVKYLDSPTCYRLLWLRWYALYVLSVVPFAVRRVAHL